MSPALLAILLTLALGMCAQPAFAQQDTARCATVTVSRATVEDIPDLIAAAECFGRAMVSAAQSQQLRLRKALELTRPGEQPEPHDPHDGHPMPDPPPWTPLTVDDIVPIDGGFDMTEWTTASGVPGSAGVDPLGAFRLICNMGQINYDDPIVYPDQPGKAHLHHWFGNTLADAFSTYESLRASGDSTCQGDVLNRSAYWMPALLDGKGHVVVPDWVSLYYKRLPAANPLCVTRAARCEGIPPGLKALFGTNYKLGELQSANVRFDCGGRDKSPVLAGALANCGPGDKLNVQIDAPDCWDGANLDSEDHQSHMAYQVRNRQTGQPACPATHPVMIPRLTLTVQWSIEAGDTPEAWIFSSDAMAGAEPGATFHADYMEAWEPAARLAWEAACIDGHLNCSDGVLGDGRKLRRPPGFGYTAAPRLVPVLAEPGRSG